MNVLVPNLGSTSLKWQILEMPAERVLARGRQERVSDYREAIRAIDLPAAGVDVVAFKAVHGGPRYRGTFVVDAGVIAALEEYSPAAPVHNPVYLAGIRAFGESLPAATLVAAFETEFHATMPEHAALYGVPAGWRERLGVRRYGFHGASHQYVSQRVPAILGRPRESLLLVSCHLGGSSSICAIDGGRSISTTMGFSPQSGLEQATRPGDLDVFAVLLAMERNGWSVAQVTERLARDGGLAGLSGVPGGDLRDIEAAAAAGSADAALAIDVIASQVRNAIGAYAAAMGGLDAVAFTGGIGEHSARLRNACCQHLGFLGLRLDGERNESRTGDRVVSSADSAVAVVALATNEELIVARRAYALLCRSGP